MFSSLDELFVHIRITLPNSKLIKNVSFQPVAEGLSFSWFGHAFYARQTGEVFEIRGNTLYVTGTSALLQALLTANSEKVHTLTEIAAVLEKAEESISVKHQMNNALQSVQKARSSLSRLMGPPADQS
jgi:hypothetical protein